MKKAALAVLFLLGAINLAAQQKDTIPYLRVEDPTQLFTNVELGAGIAFLRNDVFVEPNFWAFNYYGNLAFNRFRTGFSLPFSNYGNEETGLGNIKIDFGYKVHESKGKYKATLLNAGVTFPASGNNYHLENVYAYSETPFFKLNAEAIGSIEITKRWWVYPQIGYTRHAQLIAEYERFWKYDTLPNGNLVGGYVDSGFVTPKIHSNIYSLGFSTSYRFNSKSFLLFNASWQLENWKENDPEEYTKFPNSFKTQSLYLGIRYQYALNSFSQVFFKIDCTVNNLNQEKHPYYYKDSYFVGFGWNYYLGRKQ